MSGLPETKACGQALKINFFHRLGKNEHNNYHKK